MRIDQWELMNELRDLTNFYSLGVAVKKVAKHYGMSEEALLEQYFDCDFAEDEDE